MKFLIAYYHEKDHLPVMNSPGWLDRFVVEIAFAKRSSKIKMHVQQNWEPIG